jgi:DNA-binding LytR/AlgR family response regulator
MEDHYVRAHTDQGSDLVLLPLKAAVAELDVEGLQVHRSWWVARAAVTTAVQDGRNLKLRLTNGLEAPVSRASIAALRQAGWLEDVDSINRTTAVPLNQKVNGGA